MDVLSQFTEWFPDIIKPVLAQRDEAEAKYQKLEAECQKLEVERQKLEVERQKLEARRAEERQFFRQMLRKKFQKKFRCDFSSSQMEKLEYLDDLVILTNVYDYLENAEDIADFERFVDEEVRASIG